MTAIQVIPAIDLKDGRCVRLRQGRAEEATVYSDDPVSMAHHWVEQGARYLHVVDLDGAFTGRPVHYETIGRIAAAIAIPVETGGGLRTDEDLALLLEQGVARVILGTRAWAEPDQLAPLVDRFGDRVAVGIDAREGRVQIRGWTETTGLDALDLARRAEQMGVRTIIYTDTSRDGMLAGTNVEAMGAMARAVGCDIIASGGITSPRDMAALNALDCPNLVGAIVGKALYDGTTTFAALRDVS